jgi:hypothetical protein
MRIIKTLSFISAAALLTVSIGCGGGEGETGEQEGPTEIDPTGVHTKYVVDTLSLPSTPDQANQYGLNIDGDDAGRVDNALGRILAALGTAASDLDLQGNVDEQVNNGGLILLSSMQATDLNVSKGAGMWIYQGDNPDKAPCKSPEDAICGSHLDGATAFDIAADSRRDAVIGGDIVNAHFNGGPGSVTIQLALVGGAPPITFNMIGARADVGVNPDSMDAGRLGGAITEEELQSNVLPGIHSALIASSAGDCTGEAPECCTPGSSGELIMDLFDTDGSCEVTLEEFRNNSLIASLLAPDVDLLDETGAFNPRQDGVDDSLSLGIGFSAVGATFRVPTE